MDKKYFHDFIINQNTFKNWKQACWIVQLCFALSNYIWLRLSDKFIQESIDIAIAEKILSKENWSRIEKTLPFICDRFNDLGIFASKIGYRFFKLTSEEIIRNLGGYDNNRPCWVMCWVYVGKTFKADALDDAIIQTDHWKWKWHFANIVRAFDMWSIINYKIVLWLWRRNEIVTINDVDKREDVMNWWAVFTWLVNPYD